MMQKQVTLVLTEDEFDLIRKLVVEAALCALDSKGNSRVNKYYSDLLTKRELESHLVNVEDKLNAARKNLID